MALPIVVNMDKTGEALINRVSDAVGGLLRPWQTKRVAKADAEAKKILAIADIEITDIQQRAVRRLVLEEEKNQVNIESITARAIPHLSAEAKPEELDEDFVRYLFEKARLVSNEEMQSVWAKILAGEANKAGSFSRRTMDLVAQLAKEEAELFTRFCTCVWHNPQPFSFLLFNPSAVRLPYEWAFSFDELAHLEFTGLIRYDIAGYLEEIESGRNTIQYFGCDVAIDLGNLREGLFAGNAILTAAGRQLVAIAGAKPNLAYFEQSLDVMSDQGAFVSIPIDAKKKYLAL